MAGLSYVKTTLPSLGLWENCMVELEQTGTEGEVDFGTISIFGVKKNKVTFLHGGM